MLFNSPIFLPFIVVVLAGYALLQTPGSRKLLLLVASYLFYADWNPLYLPLLWLSTGVDYAIGRRFRIEMDGTTRRRLLLASLTVNLGVLAFFKYARFAAANLEWLWGGASGFAAQLPEEIPLGISFYTFQTLSYSIDRYRGRERPADSLLDFALFVAFFPQLIAGPIVRSSVFLPQLRTITALRVDDLTAGLQRFALGLFKKVVIADNVALYVDAVFATPGEFGAITLWCGAFAFALQIYCDFSGYTDMALGISRAFGLQLPENFRAPYLSSSLTEFWRRWHISLSSWLRDYLYIPLGGSRRGTRRTYVNLLATMLLGGLWHGAAWTFVIWGAFHGLLLAIERGLGVGRALPATTARKLGAGTLTFLLVAVGWVMFRAESLDLMAVHLAGMLGDYRSDIATPQGVFWLGVLLVMVGGQHAARRLDFAERVWPATHPAVQGGMLAAVFVAVGLFYVDEIAFLYFQF